MAEGSDRQRKPAGWIGPRRRAGCSPSPPRGGCKRPTNKMRHHPCPANAKAASEGPPSSLPKAKDPQHTRHRGGSWSVTGEDTGPPGSARTPSTATPRRRLSQPRRPGRGSGRAVPKPLRPPAHSHGGGGPRSTTAPRPQRDKLPCGRLLSFPPEGLQLAVLLTSIYLGAHAEIPASHTQRKIQNWKRVPTLWAGSAARSPRAAVTRDTHPRRERTAAHSRNAPSPGPGSGQLQGPLRAARPRVRVGGGEGRNGGGEKGNGVVGEGDGKARSSHPSPVLHRPAEGGGRGASSPPSNGALLSLTSFANAELAAAIPICASSLTAQRAATGPPARPPRTPGDARFYQVQPIY